MQMQNKGLVFLRYAMALLFIWFGYAQLANSVAWTLFLPAWTASLPISAVLFVQMNGVMEIVFGMCMFVGFFTRLVSLLLGLHLMIIAVSVGKDIDVALGVRDAGLAAAAWAIAMNSADELTVDAKIKSKKLKRSAAAAETAKV